MLYRRIIDENIHLEVSWQFTVCLPESSSVPYISVMSERTRIFRLFAAPAVAVNLLVKLPINAGDGDENEIEAKCLALAKRQLFTRFTPEDGKSKFGFFKLELQQRSEVFF